jgi:hypothetical protein
VALSAVDVPLIANKMLVKEPTNTDDMSMPPTPVAGLAVLLLFQFPPFLRNQIKLDVRLIAAQKTSPLANNDNDEPTYDPLK